MVEKWMYVDGRQRHLDGGYRGFDILFNPDSIPSIRKERYRSTLDILDTGPISSFGNRPVWNVQLDAQIPLSVEACNASLHITKPRLNGFSGSCRKTPSSWNEVIGHAPDGNKYSGLSGYTTTEFVQGSYLPLRRQVVSDADWVYYPYDITVTPGTGVYVVFRGDHTSRRYNAEMKFNLIKVGYSYCFLVRTTNGLHLPFIVSTSLSYSNDDKWYQKNTPQWTSHPYKHNASARWNVGVTEQLQLWTYNWNGTTFRASVGSAAAEACGWTGDLGDGLSPMGAISKMKKITKALVDTIVSKAKTLYPTVLWDNNGVFDWKMVAATSTPPDLKLRDSDFNQYRLLSARRYAISLFKGVKPSSDHTLGLYSEAQRFNGNAIAFASDLKKTGDTIRSLLSLIHDPADPKKWASAWLSLRYGDKLQIRDARDLISSIKQSLAEAENSISRSWRTLRYRSGVLLPDNVPHPSSEVSGYIASKVYFDDITDWGLADDIRHLLEWDVWPTLENVWDLIPFSFVVDWFVSVSDVLNRMDAMFYASTLAVREYLWTTRLEVPLSFDGIEGKFILYERRIEDRLHPVESGSWTSSSPSMINVIDGTSLVVEFI
jgi:hypothetical protein